MFTANHGTSASWVDYPESFTACQHFHVAAQQYQTGNPTEKKEKPLLKLNSGAFIAQLDTLAQTSLQNRLDSWAVVVGEGTFL